MKIVALRGLLGSSLCKIERHLSWIKACVSTTVSDLIGPVPVATVVGSTTGLMHNWLRVTQGYERDTVGKDVVLFIA